MTLILEEKKSINWNLIILAVVLIIFLIGLSYYIFFLKPEVVELAISKNLSSLNELSKIQIEPEKVLNNPLYKNLKVFYEEESILETPGRLNPFEPY